MANEVWHLGHEANAVAWYGTPNYVTTAGYFRSPQSRCAAQFSSTVTGRIVLPGVRGATAEGWWFRGTAYMTRRGFIIAFMNNAVPSFVTSMPGDGYVTYGSIYANGNATPATSVISNTLTGKLFNLILHCYTGANDASAKIDIYVDDIFITSLSTGSTGHVPLTHIDLKGGDNGYDFGVTNWSEICLANFDLRGKEVVTLPPIANGIYTETAGGYADIDEYTPDAAGVIWGADGQRYSYKTAALGLANRRLVALGYAGKASASDGRHLSTFVRVDGVDYPLGTLVSGGFPQIGQTIALVNPATGAAWPVAALPDLEWGLQLDLDPDS